MITKPEELQEKKTLKGLIYGVPGGGKTTCALSAPSPLIVDIDCGLGRVEPKFRTDSVQVTDYQDILNMLDKDDLTAYQTLVIDTAGKLVDMMGDYVIKTNPNLKQGDGSLTQKGWGVVKISFHNFFRRIENLQKHLVFIAHEKEEKDGDLRYLRPDIAGGAKNDLIKELDFMGYLEVVGGRRTMHFSPSAKFYAKNSIGITDFLALPDTANGNTFLSETIFKQVLEKRKKEAEDIVIYDNLLAEGKEIIAKAKDANEATKAISKLNEIWDSKKILWNLIKEKAAAEGKTYDAKAKKFVAKEEEPKEAEKCDIL